MQITGWMRQQVFRNKRLNWLTILEIAVVLAWTYFFTQALFDLDSNNFPLGREFSWGIEPNFAWQRLLECGGCIFWNGNFQGGQPSFASPMSSFLHPLVFVTTAVWGVVNGGKMALAGSFFLAGLSQWFLGRVLGLGRVARVWGALAAVTGGHIAARMELGVFGVILSTATFPLVLALFLWLKKSPGNRRSVLLGASLAVLALGGQGYLQAGAGMVFLLGLLGLRVFYWNPGQARFFRYFGKSLLLAAILAAPFLIPFIHFLPNFGKTIDPSFSAAQSMGLSALNLVINDYGFYKIEALGRPAFPAHYILYIGWIPVLLAILALRENFKTERGEQVFLLVVLVFAAFWVGSAGFLKLLIRLSPITWFDQFLMGLRFPSFMLGLAIPPLLALSAIGADRLLQQKTPELSLGISNSEAKEAAFKFPLTWLLIPVLALAIQSEFEMNSRFMVTTPIAPHVELVMQGLDENLSDSQWVNLPFGEQFWIQPALGRGYKIGFDFTRTWTWPERLPPSPYLEINYGNPPPGLENISVVAGLQLHRSTSGPNYARVEHDDGTLSACTAQSAWGNIDVRCTLNRPGTLRVQEYVFSGWRARVDGETAALEESVWLEVGLPAGDSTVEFRYRPWDAPLGILVSLAGIVWAAWDWRREVRETAEKIDPE